MGTEVIAILYRLVSKTVLKEVREGGKWVSEEERTYMIYTFKNRMGKKNVLMHMWV